MKILPMGERVLVRMEVAAEKTASGLIIPQTAQEKTQMGIVEAIGDSEEITVKSGDKIMYDKYAGTTIKVDGEEMLILKMESILAVIK